MDSPFIDQMVAMLIPIADSVRVVPTVTAVSHSDDGLRRDLRVDVHPRGRPAFAAPAFEQAAPFAAQLGLELRESGCIAIDQLGHTSVPGVYAAGDLAHVADLPMPMPSVLAAKAAGQTAGAAVVRDLAS